MADLQQQYSAAPSLRDKRASAGTGKQNTAAAAVDQDLALARQLAAQEHVQATADAMQAAAHHSNGHHHHTNGHHHHTAAPVEPPKRSVNKSSSSSKKKKKKKSKKSSSGKSKSPKSNHNNTTTTAPPPPPIPNNNPNPSLLRASANRMNNPALNPHLSMTGGPPPPLSQRQVSGGSQVPRPPNMSFRQVSGGSQGAMPRPPNMSLRQVSGGSVGPYHNNMNASFLRASASSQQMPPGFAPPGSGQFAPPGSGQFAPPGSGQFAPPGSGQFAPPPRGSFVNPQGGPPRGSFVNQGQPPRGSFVNPQGQPPRGSFVTPGTPGQPPRGSFVAPGTPGQPPQPRVSFVAPGTPGQPPRASLTAQQDAQRMLREGNMSIRQAHPGGPDYGQWNGRNPSRRQEYAVTDQPSSWLDLPSDNFDHLLEEQAKVQQEYEDSRAARRMAKEEQMMILEEDDADLRAEMSSRHGSNQRSSQDQFRSRTSQETFNTRDPYRSQERFRSEETIQTQTTPRKLCPGGRMTVGTLIVLLLTVGIVVGIVAFIMIGGGGGDDSGSGNNNNGDTPGDTVGPNISDTDFIDNDPQFGETDPIPWLAGDGISGLSMIVMNALDTSWYPFFYKAVNDWDQSDSLRLETQVKPYEYNCTAVTGFIKVCSGDYGNTSWRGLNEVEIVSPPGRIHSSRARMNEFYIQPSANNADQEFVEDEAQYVMCHELGHALGLVHTDENFDNEDTFNCLDYTRNPGLNNEPGQINFNILESMYGTIGASASPNGNRKTKSVERQFNNHHDNMRDESNDNNNNDVRERHRNHHPTRADQDGLASEQTRDQNWLASEEMQQVYDSDTGRRLQPHLWKEIHKSPHAEVHEISLSNGRSLRVQKLL